MLPLAQVIQTMVDQANKPKSVLDNILQICSVCGNNKQDHDAIGLPFPCGMPPRPHVEQEKNQEKDSVVGACPTCGCPIYGQVFVDVGTQPQVKRTCNCWQRPGLATNVDEKKLGTTKEG